MICGTFLESVFLEAWGGPRIPHVEVPRGRTEPIEPTSKKFRVGHVPVCVLGGPAAVPFWN